MEQSKGCIDIEICGFDEVFKSYSEKNPSTIEAEHDTGKVRDKYTEILEAVGIDRELLRAKEKVTDIYGKTVRGGTFFHRNLLISVRLLYRNIPHATLKNCVVLILTRWL